MTRLSTPRHPRTADLTCLRCGAGNIPENHVCGRCGASLPVVYDEEGKVFNWRDHPSRPGRGGSWGKPFGIPDYGLGGMAGMGSRMARRGSPTFSKVVFHGIMALGLVYLAGRYLFFGDFPPVFAAGFLLLWVSITSWIARGR